ncbi:MAG: protein kinase, partial [Anaerolineales bacterium]|nr:protein kinase [Anaerolineales bacterium]
MTLRKVGRYELIEEIGKGGMATVFRAFDPIFKREVAVKLLDKSLLHEPSLKARFEREAQTIAALEHPAIVPVYDFGEEDGHLYLVMRLMLGGSLANRIAQGPLPLSDVLHILQRIGSALDRAHLKGVIHRDLKPGNIMFDEYGDAYLGDFGIARLTESTVTLTGDNIIGTPAYMSPEQIHGDKTLDSRSDIYALGVICFEMLTGQRPYTDSSPSRVMMRHVMDPIPDIRQLKPDLPPRVENVITQSMAKQPAERFATAAALTDTFEGVLQGAEMTGAQEATTVVEPVAVTRPVTAPRPEPTPLPVEMTPQTEVAVPSFAAQNVPARPSRPRWLWP